jgi:hypothetical protein
MPSPDAAATISTKGSSGSALNSKAAHAKASRRSDAVLGAGRLKALATTAVVVQRLNIVAPKLLEKAPMLMLGVASLVPTQRPSADEEWLQSAARKRPAAAARTPESKLLKEKWLVGQHWSMGALPKMPHLDPRDGAGLIIAEQVSKLPFVIFVAEKTQASFV